MRKAPYTSLTFATLCSLPLFASDTILIHGHVYTGNANLKWGEAIALTGEKIDAVGSDQEISKRRDGKTKVIDLQGRTVIPGIIDAHTHMWFGGLALRGFNFATPEIRITADQPDLLVARIKEYAATHRADKVLFGRMQDRRLRLTHIGSIIPDNISRFSRLSVVPDLQPAFCSDWPCSWPPNPFFGVQEATLRQVRQQPTLTWSTTQFSLPEERLTVEQAIEAYTTAAPMDIGKTHPVMTMVGGKIVYEQSN